MPVLGMGGFFFRAHDPDVLSAWYRDHLGIGAGLAAEGTDPADEWSWTVRGGPVVFAPFPADTDYWAADRQFMLNLRVSDLDGLLDGLRASGIEVTTKAEWDSPETGRFRADPRPRGQRDRTVGATDRALTQSGPAP